MKKFMQLSVVLVAATLALSSCNSTAASGIENGKATVTATCGGFSASVKVTVDKNVGIKGIETESSDSAEYYDLQGMRLSAPEKGRPVIVRQGGRTFKAIL